MRANSTLKNYFLLSLLISSIQLSAQTFVKQDASGTNDGTSWENAYTDLSEALDSTSSGEIWIATGTYFPGSGMPDTSSSFNVNNVVALYGGFAGTESSLEEREVDANPTILSGDLNEDDIQEDFESNKSDNLLHVVVVEAGLAGPIIFDGLIIQGGNTTDNNDLDEFFWRGGGIFSYGPVEINNCKFFNNFARSGGGVYLSPNLGPGGTGSVINNCTFSYNFATSQSSGIFIQDAADITVRNSTFSNNRNSRGAFYPADCNNVLVDSCLFENNTDQFIDGFGGALFIWQGTNITLSNTTFRDNVSGNGASIYHDGREVALDPSNLLIENCLFEDNNATDFGAGGLYAWRGSFTVNNSIFRNNNSANSGAHIVTAGDDKRGIITNNIFEGGTATFGGAHSLYGANSFFTVSNNEYSNNTANTSGGAIITGFLANSTIDSCTFINNTASFGGAIYCQNDSTTVGVYNSSFFNNEAADFGGSVASFGGIDVIVDKCLFETSISGFGGAISIVEGDAPNEANFFLSNSIFNFCLANTQGGALNLVDVNSSLSNNVFTNDVIAGMGAGGAISNNSTDSNTVVVDLINSTFSNNFAFIGPSISQFTTELESFCTMNVQNCIFDNLDAVDYAGEAGTPVLVSNGGNLVTQTEMLDSLNNPLDIEGDPMFVDPDDFDFRLLEGSAAIDAGIEEGAPEEDLDGNPRVGAVDIGAYEFQMDVATEEVIENNGALIITPNPASENAHFQLDNNWKGIIDIQIKNVLGQQLKSWKMTKAGQILSVELELQKLKSGIYYLNISNGKALISTSFIKL